MLNKSDLYKLIIETANEGIWVIDKNNDTTFANAKMESILGYDEGEMIGKNLFSFMNAQGESLAKRYLKRKEISLAKTLDLRFESKQGKNVWTQIKTSPIIQDGAYKGSLAMLTDITFKKEREQEQLLVTRNYRSLFEDSPVPIWDEDFSEVKQRVDELKAAGVTDFRKHFEKNTKDLLYCADGLKVNDVNQAVLDLNEADSKEHMLNDYTSLVTRKSLDYAKEQIIAVANGETSFQQEVELKTFKGNIRHTLMKWTVVKGYENSYKRVYLSTTDLTDKIIEENKFLHKTNNEKELLLKEIHHRVKNNLQVIIGLLNLQSINIVDENAKSLFEVSIARIQSMSVVHELLYQSKDFEKIDYQEYLKVLIDPLVESMKPERVALRVDVNVDDIMLNVGTSIPLGLIINEIVTNSLKHAFVKEEGSVYIRMYQVSLNKYQLNIGDDGVGMPSDFELCKSQSLGLQLVSNLAQQLQGQLSIAPDKKGTHYQLIFDELTDKSIV